MIRLFFFTVSLIFIQSLSAQDLTLLELKRPVTEKDYPDLIKHLRDGFEPEGNIQFEYSSISVVTELPLSGEKIVTEADLQKALEELKKDPENIDWLMTTGNFYGALNYPKKSFYYYSKALDKIAKASKITPDDAKLFEKAGLCYTALGNYQMMILSYEKTLKLDPAKDTVARYLLPLAYMATGFYEKLEDLAKEQIQKNPDDLIMHIYSTFGDLYQILSTGFDFGPKTQEQFYAEYSIFDYVDTSLIHQSLKSKPDDVALNHIVKGVNMYGLLLKVYGTFDYKNNKVVISEKDKKDIEALIKFHGDIIRKNKTNNPYLDYLSLGILHFLLGENKDALENYEKAIASIPSGKSTKNFNTAAAYDDILTLHLYSGDTLKAEQALDRKIAARPLLYKSAADYHTKAVYCFRRNDMTNAKNNLNECFAADSNFRKAEILSAAILVQENDFKKALEKLGFAYAGFNSDFYFNYVYGILSLMQNDTTMAKISFTKALAIAPGDKTINRIIDTYFKVP